MPIKDILKEDIDNAADYLDRMGATSLTISARLAYFASTGNAVDDNYLLKEDLDGENYPALVDFSVFK